MRAVDHVHLLRKINYIKLYDINIDISSLLLNKVSAILILMLFFHINLEMTVFMKIIMSKKEIMLSSD